jgi:hypothetical protein
MANPFAEPVTGLVVTDPRSTSIAEEPCANPDTGCTSDEPNAPEASPICEGAAVPWTGETETPVNPIWIEADPEADPVTGVVETPWMLPSATAEDPALAEPCTGPTLTPWISASADAKPTDAPDTSVVETPEIKPEAAAEPAAEASTGAIAAEPNPADTDAKPLADPVTGDVVADPKEPDALPGTPADPASVQIEGPTSPVSVDVSSKRGPPGIRYTLLISVSDPQTMKKQDYQTSQHEPESILLSEDSQLQKVFALFRFHYLSKYANLCHAPPV